ncbi:MAG: glycosyltransferase family 39 protein [Planctomycetia bacterium]|nr:glycosyltransferase family 39 protein [Planctomycetia bacterium]
MFLKKPPLIVWVLLAGLVLRLGIFFAFPSTWKLYIVDEKDYNQLAVHLVDTGMFQAGGELVSIRPPLYPWFLSQIYKVWGSENYSAVRLFQIALSLATVGCVYGMAREFSDTLSERGALLAAALFCLYPSMVGENFLLLTETLFTFWLVLVLWTATRFFRTGSLYAVCFCGVFMALGALTRSILWMAPVPFALFLLFWPSWMGWKRRLAGAFLLVLFAGTVMAPWMIRNTRVQRTFTAIDCMSGRNLMMGNYEHTPFYRAWDAVGVPAPNDWYTVLLRDGETRGEQLYRETQGVVDRRAGEYAKRFILQNPGLTLRRDAMKACCFWQLERSLLAGFDYGFWGISSWSLEKRLLLFVLLGGVIQLCYVFVLYSAMAGIFSTRFSSWSGMAAVFLLCVVVYFWGIHSLIFSHERYHLPLVPILTLFAAMFWSQYAARWEFLKTHPKRLVSGGVVAMGLLAFWIWEIFLVLPV